MSNKQNKIFIAHIQAHGLMEAVPHLGYDQDTGGQIQYVLDLSKILCKNQDVRKVEIVCRKLKGMGDTHTKDETISDKCKIVRVDCSPYDQYIRKELLWDKLDFIADRFFEHFRNNDMPDIIHAHYADAAYIGARICCIANIPLIYTGHSLGIPKKQYLLHTGMKLREIEERYNITKRIQAEELGLQAATRIVCSTKYEKHNQWGEYNFDCRNKISVIPPGIDLSRFSPKAKLGDHMRNEIEKFLSDPSKPIVLALSRPVQKKNILAVVEAYGKNEKLKEIANVVLIMGCREDLEEIDSDARNIFDSLFELIDKYDLYGKVAYPKKHKAEDVPGIYAYVAQHRGVFTNVAFHEPFGLTALEASASGVPLVVTSEGGVVDIIDHLKNGKIVDPNNIEGIAAYCLELISNKDMWDKYSECGKHVKDFYNWDNHADLYLRLIKDVIKDRKSLPECKNLNLLREKAKKSKMILVSDIDGTLIGDDKATNQTKKLLESNRDKIVFITASGRHYESSKSIIEDHSLPEPDCLITDAGAYIYYTDGTIDNGYEAMINRDWNNKQIDYVMSRQAHLVKQPSENQKKYKISYDLDIDTSLWLGAPRKEFLVKKKEVERIERALYSSGAAFKIIFSHLKHIDVLPFRANKGSAVRYLAYYMGVPLDKIFTFGDSKNDLDMLTGSLNGIAVANRQIELEGYKDVIYSDLDCANAINNVIERVLAGESIEEDLPTKKEM